MGVRRQAREWALQFLFQRDINPGDLEEALQDFWAEKQPSSKAMSYAEELIRGVESNRPQLDTVIGQSAHHWDVKRMGGVDRNAMRMALYEIMFRSDIPPVVAIDEAVEIAKAYSSNESGRFVNGILDRALREWREGSAPTPTGAENT